MDSMQRIGDAPFLLPYMEYNSAKYETYLEEKKEIMHGHFTALLASLPDSTEYDIDIISSPATHSRQKCRFGIGRDDKAEYNGLVHMMWKFGGGPSKPEYACLVAHFTSVSYLSALSEHLLITMVYDRSDEDVTGSSASFCSEEEWHSAAAKVLTELKELNVPNVSKLSIIGRWK
eukprot:gene15062-17262_t